MTRARTATRLVATHRDGSVDYARGVAFEHRVLVPVLPVMFGILDEPLLTGPVSKCTVGPGETCPHGWTVATRRVL